MGDHPPLLARLALFATALAWCSSCSCGEEDAQPIEPAAAEVDTDQMMRKLSPLLRERFETSRGRDEMKRALADKALLFAEAKRQGLLDRQEIRDEVRRLEERLAVQALLSDEVKKTAPTDDDLRAFWERNQDEFSQEERVRLGRVFVATKGERTQARARAESLRRRLEKGGKLADVAKDGDGAERVRGGDLGFVRRDGDDRELCKAGFKLEKLGELSQVVETEGGFSILVLLERSQARVIPFLEARALVENRMRPSIERTAFDALIRRLRAENGRAP